MSLVRKAITFRNPENNLSLTVTALVDSGSTLTVLPRSDAEQLRLRSMGTRELELADKSVVNWDVAVVQVDVVGRSAGATCAFGDTIAEPILGVTALEQLGLAVDPVNEELVPVRGRLGGVQFR